MGQCAKSIEESEHKADDGKTNANYHYDHKKNQNDINFSLIPSYLTWSELINFIEYHLYPTIAKQISQIIETEEIPWQAIYYTPNEEKQDKSKKGLEFIIRKLKLIRTLNIDNDEAQYIRYLIERAKQSKGKLFKNGLEVNFKYVSDFDQHGLLYFLGTEYGMKSSWSNPAISDIVRVESSSIYWKSDIKHLVGRSTVDCRTKNVAKNQWMRINIKNVKIRLTHYTLRHMTDYGSFLRNWNLEGSNDGNNWTSIRKHRNDTSINERGATATWKVKTNEYFNQFRIFMTGKNSGSGIEYPNWTLACSGIEFYGDSRYDTSIDDDNNETDISYPLMTTQVLLQKAIEFKQGLSTIDFKYSHDFDTNGLFYYFGTEYGINPSWSNPAISDIIRIESSSLGKYSEPLTALAGRCVQRCHTDNIPNQWMKVDLKDVKIKLTHYSLRHYNFNHSYLRNWNLEGSNDGNNWILIEEHKNDASLKGGEGATATWKVDTTQYFNQFRILMTGKNSNDEWGDHWELACSGLELYGNACDISHISSIQTLSPTLLTDKPESEILSFDMIEDIYSVHNALLFGYHRRKPYLHQHFLNDLRLNAGLSLNHIILNNLSTINLYPSFVINDEVFTIWDQLFIVSKFVHSLKNDENLKSVEFTLRIFIIPKQITSIYNQNVIYNFDERLTQFLSKKGISMTSWPLSTKIEEILETLPRSRTTPNFLICIDRRQGSQTIITANTENKVAFIELESNYNLGLCFTVSPPNGITKCHMFYGQKNENKLRFYPEHLITIIPKLFKKDPSIRPYQLVQKLYSDHFKHGFCCDLTDPHFNSAYRRITGFLHISNNYNRRIIYETDNKEAEKDKASGLEIIIWNTKCNKQSCANFEECPLIQYMVEILCKFRDLNYIGIKMSDFDLKKIAACYDHIIKVHKAFLTHETRQEATKYFVSKVNECKYEDNSCICLEQHTLRGRYGGFLDNNNPQISDDEELSYILVEYLNSLHSYLIHSGDDLFRLRRLTEDDDESKEAPNKIERFTTSAEKTQPSQSLAIAPEIQLGEYIVMKINTLSRNPLITRNQLCEEIGFDADDWLEDEEYDSDAIEYDLLCNDDDKEQNDYSQSNIYVIITSNNKQDLLSQIWEKYINVYNNSIIGIDFGDSILKWSAIPDDAINYSLDDVANCLLNGLNKYEPNFYKPAEAIKQWIEQCKLEKEIYNKKGPGHYQWKVSELLCLRAYTNTNALCSKFRSSFWKINSENRSASKLRDEFWIWALLMYQTHLYHATPINPITTKSGVPIKLYHGLNQIFAVTDQAPLYNGPVSTTAERSVAHRFSDGEGLLWYINSNYYSPFRILTGIDVTNISQYKGESEILLNNQNINISRTINFASTEQDKVDQFLVQLQIYQNSIKDNKDKNDFWTSIGFDETEIMENKEIISIILDHPLLFKSTMKEQNKRETVFHRLNNELNCSDPRLLIAFLNHFQLQFVINKWNFLILKDKDGHLFNSTKYLAVDVSRYSFFINSIFSEAYTIKSLADFRIKVNDGQIGCDLIIKATNKDQGMQKIQVKCVDLKPIHKFGEGDGITKSVCKSTMSISSNSIINASEYGLNKQMTEFYKPKPAKANKAGVKSYDELIVIEHGKYVGDESKDEIDIDDNSGRGGGIIWLESEQGDIINHGTIKSIGSDNKYSGGVVVINCKNGIFRNYGSIQCSRLIIIADDIDIHNGQGQTELAGGNPELYIKKVPNITIYKYVTNKGKERKIDLEYVNHREHAKGDEEDQFHPRNLLDDDEDTCYRSKKGATMGDWIMFKMLSNNIYPTKLVIINDEEWGAIKKLSILIQDKDANDVWYKLASIEDIERRKEEIEYPLSILLSESFVCTKCSSIIKIKLHENYGYNYNRFFSFCVWGS